MQQKIQTFIIIALVCAFGLYMYTFPPHQDNGTGTVPAEDTLVRTGFATCTDCEEQTVGQPIDHFKRALQLYREKIWDSVNRYTFGIDTKGLNYSSLQTLYPGSDARSLWFSIESVKQFICTIEKNNALLHQPAQKLGIRLYYGVYEDDYDDATKQKRHTLFMVPTYNKGGNDEVDFDPRETLARQNNTLEYGTRYDSVKVSFADLLATGGTLRYTILGEKEPNVTGRSTSPGLIRNNGEMCPVNCPTVNTLSQIDN